MEITQMKSSWKSWMKFSLRDVLVIFLGIAIGYSLNLTSVRLLLGPANEARMSRLPQYVIEPPDILLIDSNGQFSDACPQISGKYLVGPDGRVNLGALGSFYVAGCTLSQAESAIERKLNKHVKADVTVNVFACNSKTCYVITQGNGFDRVMEMPITGNDTVLDAIAQIGGIDRGKRLWISRPGVNGVGDEVILPVNWNDISEGGSALTNYQLMPRDRLYIETSTTTAKTE
jgi:polysaccharide export outer membrane protein